MRLCSYSLVTHLLTFYLVVEDFAIDIRDTTSFYRNNGKTYLVGYIILVNHMQFAKFGKVSLVRVCMILLKSKAKPRMKGNY